MKNIEQYQLKKAIFMKYEEFLKLTEKLGLLMDYDDGLYLADNSTTDEDAMNALSEYFDVKVISVHVDDHPHMGVWIVYKDNETSAEASSGNIYESLNLTVAPGDIEISEDDKDHAILRHNCFLEVPAYRWYSAEKVYLSFVGDMDEALGRPYAMIERWDVEEQYDNGNLGIHRHQPI